MARKQLKKKGKSRRNPLLGNVDLELIERSIGDFAILQAVRGCTMREKVVIGAAIRAAVIPALREFKHVDLDQAANKIAAGECACKGECFCHLGFGGETCPRNCPNFGTRFDGCHRCDCQGVKRAT
jgi:hypothetical protein